MHPRYRPHLAYFNHITFTAERSFHISDYPAAVRLKHTELSHAANGFNLLPRLHRIFFFRPSNDGVKHLHLIGKCVYKQNHLSNTEFNRMTKRAVLVRNV